MSGKHGALVCICVLRGRACVSCVLRCSMHICVCVYVDRPTRCCAGPQRAGHDTQEGANRWKVLLFRRRRRRRRRRRARAGPVDRRATRRADGVCDGAGRLAGARRRRRRLTTLRCVSAVQATAAGQSNDGFATWRRLHELPPVRWSRRRRARADAVSTPSLPAAAILSRSRSCWSASSTRRLATTTRCGGARGAAAAAAAAAAAPLSAPPRGLFNCFWAPNVTLLAERRLLNAMRTRIAELRVGSDGAPLVVAGEVVASGTTGAGRARRDSRLRRVGVVVARRCAATDAPRCSYVDHDMGGVDELAAYLVRVIAPLGSLGVDVAARALTTRRRRRQRRRRRPTDQRDARRAAHAR